jgi:hypothetical protein
MTAVFIRASATVVPHRTVTNSKIPSDKALLDREVPRCGCEIVQHWGCCPPIAGSGGKPIEMIMPAHFV